MILMIRLLKMDYTTRALKHSQDHFMVQKLHSALAKANTGLKKISPWLARTNQISSQASDFLFLLAQWARVEESPQPTK